MISGETRLIAESSASGMWISAVVNSTIAAPSSAVRPSTMRLNANAQRIRLPHADQERADHHGRDQSAHGDDLAERVALRGQLHQHVVDRRMPPSRP